MEQLPEYGKGTSGVKTLRPEISLLSLAVVLALLLSGWWQATISSTLVNQGAGPVKVTIPPGATAREVGEILKSRGVVKSALAFRLYAFWRGADQQLKPGVYRLQPGTNLKALLEQLVAGRIWEEEFTIPEGYNLKQIARLLEAKGLMSQAEFWRAVAQPYDYEFLAGITPSPHYLEGFLFPDTYRVAVGAKPETIIRKMLDRFQEVYSEVIRYRAPGLELNTLQVVTLASLVEKEAKLDEERPLIAGVFLNRLRKGMKLESCATVEYLLEEPKPVLSYQDLEIDSPYNTYRVFGLPPGPIASPGKASLLAALNPAPTEYLYFVARPDGSHEFSRTLEEHNAAIRRYQAHSVEGK
ncbi:UPF0755 protein [Thermanaeromonas toyohensis ToBE]|uniref:Endolytic murein transglycosylase n=1 Tax=Thermanaeromonas toyohensis ToBE TaxID=698762 RepID=A0A1W1VZL1_9FIRM|nr:endolytic transglycosylase MltG [Thermanaeromonas toyohensis]SMB98703.1 UPF0755 protein [Thermanaeromonas toyohensis ToBE]